MIASELRSRRHALGLTQEALAQRLGVTVTTVARWERGETPITRPSMLRVMLDALADDPAVRQARSDHNARAMRDTR